MSNSLSEHEILQSIILIASRYGLFECAVCAETVKKFLIQNKISGKLIKLQTGSSKGKFGNIYHEQLQQNISTNGYHVRIAIILGQQELIFDNIHHLGVSRNEWFSNFRCLAQDLGENFEITEIEF